MDPRKIQTAAERSLDVVLHLLPQATRDLREILRYALTNPEWRSIGHGMGTTEQVCEFAHQKILFAKLYEGMQAMSEDRWGVADKCFQEVIPAAEDLRPRLQRERFDKENKKLRDLLDGTHKRTPLRQDGQNGEEK
jgi:hypothetical protein